MHLNAHEMQYEPWEVGLYFQNSLSLIWHARQIFYIADPTKGKQNLL